MECEYRKGKSVWSKNLVSATGGVSLVITIRVEHVCVFFVLLHRSQHL